MILRIIPSIEIIQEFTSCRTMLDLELFDSHRKVAQDDHMEGGIANEDMMPYLMPL